MKIAFDSVLAEAERPTVPCPAFVEHPNEEALLANRLAKMAARLRVGVIDAHTARTMMRLYLEWPRP